MSKELKLYRYYEDFGRMGELEGVFVSTEEEIDELSERPAYFGEVLGKHSDIVSYNWKDFITVLSDDQEFINKVIDCGISNVGLNPLTYIEYDE